MNNHLVIMFRPYPSRIYTQGSVYETSFYHQSTEFILPMVDAAVRAHLAPEVIWWRFQMLPVTRAMFEAAFPDTLIVTGAESEQHFFCSRTKHTVMWRPFSSAAADHKSTWTPVSANPAMRRSIDVGDMLKVSRGCHRFF